MNSSTAHTETHRAASCGDGVNPVAAFIPTPDGRSVSEGVDASSNAISASSNCRSTPNLVFVELGRSGLAVPFEYWAFHGEQL